MQMADEFPEGSGAADEVGVVQTRFWRVPDG